MAISAKDFLNTASSCLSEDTECDYRNAASRAYYSMYHAVSGIQTQTIPHYSGGGVHHSLVVHLQNSSNGEPYPSMQQKKAGLHFKAK